MSAIAGDDLVLVLEDDVATADELVEQHAGLDEVVDEVEFAHGPKVRVERSGGSSRPS